MVTTELPPAKTGPMTRRLSYSASEVAGQLVFCVISFYLLKFYTDVYGITAAEAGAILLGARCIDAFDAPLWGIVFDRTRSRWGKSRPWFLWLWRAVSALFGVLTFATPRARPYGEAGLRSFDLCDLQCALHRHQYPGYVDPFSAHAGHVESASP